MNKFLSVVLILLLASCARNLHQQETTDYSNPEFWYSCQDTSHQVDVFYVYPTVSTVSYTDNHNSWVADINFDSVRAEANGNQRFNKILYSEYNFYAPYYRQMIFETYTQDSAVRSASRQVAASDVEAAFQYYMQHFNGGRPFFLVGHSQGSEMLIELLKKGMTDQQFQQMIAAYCIGFQITEKELKEFPTRLIPAVDSCDCSCVVLFNSVTKIDALSKSMMHSAMGINPLSWNTDSTFVSKEKHLGMAKYNDNRDSIIIIPNVTGGHLQQHVMICSDLPDDFCYPAEYAYMFPKGNLHFADSWLYAGNVIQNMACRVRHFQNPTAN